MIGVFGEGKGMIVEKTVSVIVTEIKKTEKFKEWLFLSLFQSFMGLTRAF